MFEEIQDTGQDRISVRWVLKEKFIENKRSYKARLVARGFEEVDESRSDSPTCSKDSIRIVLTVAASNEWDCESMDIKAAFLQSKPMSRIVLLKPPAEAKAHNRLWKLTRCVYGLADASRSWFISVREEMSKLGAEAVQCDPAFYYWKVRGELKGILCSHVDDFLYSGDERFKDTVRRIKSKFEISNEDHHAFSYLGLNLNNQENSFTLDQISYIQALKPIELTDIRRHNKEAVLNKTERTRLRSSVGKLNWITSQTRPDIAFDVRRIAGRIHQSTVKDIIEMNKLIKKTKAEELIIKFPQLENLRECRLVVFSDSSFANLEDSGSQGARVIFLVDKSQNAALMNWNSKRLRRVVRSTLAAETLALSDAVDTAYMINKMLSQLILNNGEKFKIECLVDSRSLVENIRTSHTHEEKRLLVDMAALREAKDEGDIDIHWIETKDNLANPLTKKSAYSGTLLEVLRNGNLKAQ